MDHPRSRIFVEKAEPVLGLNPRTHSDREDENNANIETLVTELERNPTLQQELFNDERFTNNIKVIYKERNATHRRRKCVNRLVRVFEKWMTHSLDLASWLLRINPPKNVTIFMNESTLERALRDLRNRTRNENSFLLESTLETQLEERTLIKYIPHEEEDLFVCVGVYVYVHIIDQPADIIDNARDTLRRFFLNTRHLVWSNRESGDVMIEKIDEIIGIVSLNIRTMMDNNRWQREACFTRTTSRFLEENRSAQLWLTSLLVLNSLQQVLVLTGAPHVEYMERMELRIGSLPENLSLILYDEIQMSAMRPRVLVFHGHIQYVCYSMASHLLDIKPRDQVLQIINENSTSKLNRKLFNWSRKSTSQFHLSCRDDELIHPQTEELINRDPVLRPWITAWTGNPEDGAIDAITHQDPSMYRELAYRVNSNRKSTLDGVLRPYIELIIEEILAVDIVLFVWGNPVVVTEALIEEEPWDNHMAIIVDIFKLVFETTWDISRPDEFSRLRSWKTYNPKRPIPSTMEISDGRDEQTALRRIVTKVTLVLLFLSSVEITHYTNRRRQSYSHVDAHFYYWIKQLAHAPGDRPTWAMFVLSCFERIASIMIYRAFRNRINQPEDAIAPSLFISMARKASAMRNLIGLYLSGHDSVLKGRPTSVPACLLRDPDPDTFDEDDPDVTELYYELMQLPRAVDGSVVYRLTMCSLADQSWRSHIDR